MLTNGKTPIRTCMIMVTRRLMEFTYRTLLTYIYISVYVFKCEDIYAN